MSGNRLFAHAALQRRRTRALLPILTTALMDQIPLRAFLDLLTRGVVQPRPVARRIIDARLDARGRLMLVGLAAAIQGFFWAAFATLGPVGGFGVGGQALLALLVFANYALTAAVAIHLGRRLGGRGSAEEVAAAVAWHAVLTAGLTPLQIVGLGGASFGAADLGAGGALFALLYAGLNVWLLAACVAEGHRFPSTGKVAAAIVALFLVLGLTLSLLLSGLIRS